jgi:hypothetical protein
MASDIIQYGKPFCRTISAFSTTFEQHCFFPGFNHVLAFGFYGETCSAISRMSIFLPAASVSYLREKNFFQVSHILSSMVWYSTAVGTI